MATNSIEQKPFQLIFLFVFGFLAIVGLFLFASYSGFGGGKGAAVGSVTIWGTVPTSAVKAGLDVLSVTRKEFKDVGYREVPVATFDAELANAIASGSGPDLILISQEQLLYEQSKLTLIPFSSISQRTFVSAYLPIGELFLTGEGTYGIPFLVDPLVLYYNRSLMTAAGVARPPGTWEAVSGLAQTMTTRTNDLSIVKSAIALGEFGNVTNARAIVSLLLLQGNVPLTVDTVQGKRASLLGASGGSGGVTSGVAALNFYAQFANPTKTIYSWNRSLPASRQEFIAGDLAFYIGFASEQPFLTSANPNLDFDMASIPQPATAQNVITYGNVYAFAIPKASRNSAGAFSAALGLSEDAPLSAISRVASMAPAKRSLLTPSPSDLYAPVYYPAALSAKAWLSPLPQTTDSVFATMISDITTGRQDTDGAIRSAEQALNAQMP